MIEVAALGEVLIDFTYSETNEDGYPVLSAHPGGAPSNYLAALAKFGVSTAFLGKVGTDTFGKLLTGSLQKTGINTKGVVASDEVFTTLAFVTLDESGNREFAFARKPGADTCLTFDEVDQQILNECRVLHFGTLSLTDEPSRSTTRQAVAYAKEKGKLISYDPNLRKPLWRDLEEAETQILWGLQMADVVKISDEEVEFLFDLKPEEAADHIMENFPVKLAAVTCGKDGCYIINRNAKVKVPGLSGLHITDTTGAGDIFGGSLMYKLLESKKAPEELNADELREAASFACAAAGISATRPGGMYSVPSLEEIAEIIK